MPRIFIFYFKWPNTAGNHCGMAYLAKCLKRYVGIKAKLIRTPKSYSHWRERIKRVWRGSIIKYIKLILRSDDIFFFMEYINPSQVPGDHCAIASDLRKKRINNKFVGLVHLPPNVLSENLGEGYIRWAASRVDRLIVMGNNLAEFFNKLGYGKKINLTFYYVDTNFYHSPRKTINKNKFVVFTSGYLYRNNFILKEIIQRCPNVIFDLCMGFKNLDLMFREFQNVIINKFLPEKEYLEKMQNSDISLSVFDNTVGSNVITTSLACSLPLVVSDVGAIRDYCSDENAIFCKTVDEYVNAIQFLDKNREKCFQMGMSARKRAEDLSLEKSINWYVDLFRNLL